jgi:histidine ammonia-lyase
LGGDHKAERRKMSGEKQDLTEIQTLCLVGGKKISFDEIFKIVTQNFLVTLDSNTKHDVDTFAATIHTPAIFQASTDLINKSSTSPVLLPVEFSRSALLYTVNALMQGKSGIRSEVIELIIELLNSENVPLFTSVENAQIELVLTLLGHYSSCYSHNGNISSSQALQAAQLAPITLYEHEALTLLNGEYTYPGFASYLTLGAMRAFKSLDVISSFSCESVGIPISSFDAENFDVLRPHRGQMNSASNLRLMLESSGNINTANSNQDLSSFLQIPQVNGPASDLIALAVKSDLPSPFTDPILIDL